jgi:pimeloyl-ACP methyl ester carboxylesterase
MRERFARVAGLRVRYLEEGSGPPVLLLHGASLGSSCDVWLPNLAMLAARGLRIIAFDQPGFGESDAPPDSSVAFRTRFVPQLMDALALEQADIVGHSQSGRIAVNLATKETARVRRIVVVGTASLLPPLPDAAKADAGEGDEVGAKEPTAEETRAALEGQLFDRSAATPERVALRQRFSIGRNFAAAVARREAKSRDKEAGASRPAWQRLAEVALPMRLIYGRQDRAAEKRAALALQANPALDLHLVDRCRHLVMWDAPDAFAALAGDFLAPYLP